MKGNIIIIEGMDYVGKTTAAQQVADYLKFFTSREVVMVRFPGTGFVGESVRKCIMDCVANDKEEGVDVETSMSLIAGLMLVNMKATIDRLVMPALLEGKVVVMDRFYLSTLVYQGMSIGSATNLEYIQKVMGICCRDALGDYYNDMQRIVIDSSVEVVLARQAQRLEVNPLDPVSAEEISRRREAYLVAADKYGYAVIENNNGISEAIDVIIGLIDDVFEREVDEHIDTIITNFC